MVAVWTSCAREHGNGGCLAKSLPSQWLSCQVIDARGVIRYKDLAGRALEEAVESLLAEASTPPGVDRSKQ
jgi:hypothetical protein